MNYSRFYYIELSDNYLPDYINSKLFLCRNYIIFQVLNQDDSNARSVLLVDFGKNIFKKSAIPFFFNVLKPLTVISLNRDQLELAYDFCMLFCNPDNIYYKGKIDLKND